MKKILTILTLFIFITIVPSQTSAIQEPKGFNKQIYDAAYVVYGTYKGATHVVCSATAYEKTADGYKFISAGHCVQEIPEGTVFSVAKNIGEKMIPATAVRFHEDNNLDMAIFEIKTKEHIQTIPLGNENDTRIGDKIIFAGFGEGLEKQFSTGEIATAVMKNSEVCDICAGKFVVHGTFAEGSSGSAIISKKTHKIIGVLVMGGDVGALIQSISGYDALLVAPPQKHPEPVDDTEKIIQIIIGK